MEISEFYTKYVNTQDNNTFLVLIDKYGNHIETLYTNGGKVFLYSNSLSFEWGGLLENDPISESSLADNINETDYVMMFNDKAYKEYIRNVLLVDLLEINTHAYDKTNNFYIIRNVVGQLGGKRVLIKGCSDNNEYYLICAVSSDEGYYYLMWDYTHEKLISETCYSSLVRAQNDKGELPRIAIRYVNNYFDKYLDVPFTKIYIKQENNFSRRVNKYQQIWK